jgi:hypothetical protein
MPQRAISYPNAYQHTHSNDYADGHRHQHLYHHAHPYTDADAYVYADAYGDDYDSGRFLTSLSNAWPSR